MTNLNSNYFIAFIFNLTFLLTCKYLLICFCRINSEINNYYFQITGQLRTERMATLHIANCTTNRLTTYSYKKIFQKFVSGAADKFVKHILAYFKVYFHEFLATGYKPATLCGLDTGYLRDYESRFIEFCFIENLSISLQLTSTAFCCCFLTSTYCYCDITYHRKSILRQK